MDQSESNKEKKEKKEGHSYRAPKKSFNLEFWVGLFTAVSLCAVAYLAVGLGELEIFESDTYKVEAEFDDISGVEVGASVEIAGVKIGNVSGIKLDTVNSVAVVTLKIRNEYKLRDDDIASVRTKGLIGDRYIKITPGASDLMIEPGDKIFETESVVDIEDLIGKFVHNFGDDK